MRRRQTVLFRWEIAILPGKPGKATPGGPQPAGMPSTGEHISPMRSRAVMRNTATTHTWYRLVFSTFFRAHGQSGGPDPG